MHELNLDLFDHEAIDTTRLQTFPQRRSILHQIKEPMRHIYRNREILHGTNVDPHI